MNAHDPEALSAAALALLARYRTAGVTPNLGALADAPPRQRTTGTPE